MGTGSIGELESPSRARWWASHAGARARISQMGEVGDSARRVSEGVVVPMMAVQENAAGGKGPCFVYAFDAGKRG